MNNVIDKTKELFKKIDYCSGVPDLNLNSCCKNHDDDYKIINKFKADWKFLVCGIKKGNSYAMPYKRLFTFAIITTYYLGVTLFGWWPYYKAQRE